MTETATIVASTVGTGIGIIAIVGLMLRMLTTRIDGMTSRIDNLTTEANRRFETLTNDMHKRFDQVNRELAENRERMAKLEGALEGFLAGRRDRDPVCFHKKSATET